MALVCPNGHAMDEGLFDCPACGAYRPSASTVIDDGIDGYDNYMDDDLLFPEDYCRGCEGGSGPLCDECQYDLDAEWEMYMFDREGWNY